jgi:hypothetical protein
MIKTEIIQKVTKGIFINILRNDENYFAKVAQRLAFKDQ